MKKFKKALSVFLVAVMLLTAAPLSGFVGLELPDWSIKAEAAEDEGNYYYTVTDGVATITDVKTVELSGTVTVPSTLGGYPVVAIADYAFDGASKIVSLIVPEGIKTAGNYAFRSMTGMITVEFKGIEEIGQYAFSGCSKLTDVDLGPALKKVGDYAFQSVAYINKITFPDTIEYIGYHAFYNSTNLAEINIPDKAFEIQADAFYGTAWYNAQPNGEVYLNTIFYEYKGSYPSVDTVITIKDGTKAIAAAAFFQKYYNIIEIIIPDSVQFIGYKAFYDCEELKKVNIPDGITSIEYYTFGECSGLTELVIPESVTKFETYAFYDCYNLNSINIPGGVTEIPEYTFYNCRKLESIEIPDGVTTIDKYAFYNCDALTEVEIPNGVTSIGTYAFYDCGGLKSISIPDSVTSVGSSAFYNCPAVETLHLGAKTATLGTSTYSGIGEQTVSAYAKNCLTRSFKITVVNGENDIPVIGLSDKSTYDAELTQKVMTKEEIEDAGIDTEAIGNQQVVKTEMKMVFDEELDVPPIVVETYTAGGKVVGIADTPANVVVEGEGYYSRPGSTANYYYRPPVNDQPSIIIQPVSERCYLIIRGEIKWLKEMFDIELLVVNNSATDTLEDLKATLTLPDGLSLADMIDGEQTLEQEMGTVTESSSKSVHWYVRGDKAGSYDLAAQLTGKIMPLGEEINDTFTCEDQLQVWAGNALHLHYEFPNSAYFGEDYPVTITLTNVSDRTLYNVSHLITEVEQGKIIYDPADGTKDIVYTSESDESWFAFAPEFKPGDKLVIELSIEILFGSEYMLKEIEEIFGDYAAEFVNGYEAVMSGLDAASTLISTVSAAEEALEKADIEGELAEMLGDIEKSLVSGDKVFTAAAMLVDTGLAQELELIGEDAAAWVASADIEAVTANVEALKKAIIADATEEETAAFNIFDFLRTLVTSLPTKFILGDVIFNQEGTTTIPWSYSITGSGPEYYGVSNIGSRLNGVAQAIIGATGDEVSSYLQLIPGIDNPENYVDRDTSVIAVQNEKEQFKAKDATGTVKFTAYYVPAASYSLRNRSVSAENYTLECDNESAVFENGVLTFTGDGTISLTSADANGGVLYIEDDKGNTYSYAVNVVEAHDCIAGAQKTVLSPTSEYDGFAVKCCEICDDVMEIVNLTLCDEHTFGDWATEIEANCTVGGVKKRICTSCGYAETDFIATSGHTETTINKKDATCTESGYTGDTVCGACGAEISKGQTVDALKHNMGTFTVTKEATCTADGEERADCSRCDYYETKVISAKGHTEVKLPAIAATCSKSGLTEGKKCSVCGEILVKQTETAKLEHSYKSVVTAPSCTNGGYTTYTCSVCKDTYKANETAKLGHNLGNFIIVEQPSCTEKGSEIAECSRCDYSEVKEISATGHNYQNGVCTECGDSKSNNCSCNCHKSGFMSIIWKILRFFYKLFGTNKVCGCGAAHY